MRNDHLAWCLDERWLKRALDMKGRTDDVARIPLDGKIWQGDRQMRHGRRGDVPFQIAANGAMNSRGFGMTFADQAGFTKFMADGDKAMAAAMSAAGLAKKA